VTLASTILFAASALGIAAASLQHMALRRHLRQRPAPGQRRPGASVLKPLCGVDDDLEANLATFADLDYPRYEVLLGVRSPSDPAWPVACAVAARRPDRFRVLVQRGEPGLNPKVNQLLTLAREARHDLLVVSDSNVRAPRGYLRGIADLLDDDGVGLVTHLIAGVGERRLGSLFDNLHLAGAISPGLVGAKRLLRRDFVVGKSMALRRRDLEALGGFESVKDVLAEDWVMGSRVRSVLGRRVAIAAEPVENVSRDQSLGGFLSRYARWAVLQRRAVGPLLHAGQILLNPVLLALAGVAAGRSVAALIFLAAACLAKAEIDGASARLLRPGGFRPRQLLLVPAKDLVFAFAWLHGLLSDRVRWRGNRLRVLSGTRLDLPELDAGGEETLAPGRV
jgi:ceramide glucosyltransferase